MKYSIVSINDGRKANKERIRSLLASEDEVVVEAFDANQRSWRDKFDALGLRLNRSVNGFNPERGEMGAFLSHYNNWTWAAEHGPLTVFEDDAVLSDDFTTKHCELVLSAPEDFHFVSLWVPHNQLNHYTANLYLHPQGLKAPMFLMGHRQSMFRYNDLCAYSYQGYGQVAITYSQEGAQRLLDLVDEHGVYAPVDCFMHFQSLARRVRGYAPTPENNTLVDHDWDTPTTVHGTGI